RHIPKQDIQQLRQLVQRRVPQEPSYPGDPGIIVDLEENRSAGGDRVLVQMVQRIDLGVRADIHRPELVEIEDPVSPARTFGDIENGTAGLQLDGQRDEQQDGTQHDQSNGCRQDVEESFAEMYRMLPVFLDNMRSRLLGPFLHLSEELHLLLQRTVIATFHEQDLVDTYMFTV